MLQWLIKDGIHLTRFHFNFYERKNIPMDNKIYENKVVSVWHTKINERIPEIAVDGWKFVQAIKA